MRRITVIAVVMIVLAGTIVMAAPNQQINAFQLFILEARTDLELLANEVLGVGVRMDTWTFNADLQSDTVIADLWFDNEQLANSIFGPGVRPDNWFGATTSDYLLIARNIRHDLELAADEVFGERNRPDAWVGALKIYQCNRTIQNTVRLLDAIYGARPQTSQSTFNYCETLLLEIEDELLPVMYNTIETGGVDRDIIADISAIRGDLERLGNELLGLNTRPSLWSGNLDEESATFAYDIDVDMNLLADTVEDNPEVGRGLRPEGWKPFGVSSLIVTERNMRHNLELLTDLTLGKGVRPHGWQGIDPILQCSLLEQGLVTLLERQYDFVVDTIVFSDADTFCAETIAAANHIAENPPQRTEEEEEEDSRYVAESEYAFAYLDPAALEYMGVMPFGTEFRAWYRNFGESTMMFVSGQDFAVYIDMRWTTMDEDIFNTLPNLDNVVPLTFCDAHWCNGPGPTPTPTGGGPLMAVLTYATPVATVSTVELEAKTQVSWNHIRVTYLLDRPETGTVQVALEICADTNQTDCEPVISVFDSAIGGPKPVLSQFNGLNVYEFRYGYSSNVIVEGPSRVSSDIWISDPTIR